jgi:hypothetical protein
MNERTLKFESRCFLFTVQEPVRFSIEEMEPIRTRPSRDWLLSSRNSAPLVTFQYPHVKEPLRVSAQLAITTKLSMKSKYVCAAVATVIALSVVWAGNVLWCAHRSLVTLHVRNAPLADVIHKIEHQTWEHISLDPKLNGLVTLNVRNKPLTEVLDRIGQQCGARWTTVYAVYGFKSALPKLESALFGDKKLDEVGWKLIAPAGLESDGASGMPMEFRAASGSPIIMSNGMAFGGTGSGDGPGVVINGGPLPSPRDLPPGAVVSTEDSIIKGRQSGPGPGGVMVHGRQRPGGSVMVTMRKRADGSGAVEQEIWSPVELVLESRLSPRLAETNSLAPTVEGAAQTARQVKGSWKSFYALKKSSLPANFGGGGGNFKVGEPEKRIELAGKAGTNSSAMPRHVPASIDDIAQSIQQQRLDDLGRLTPEQRVLRARERRPQTPMHP